MREGVRVGLMREGVGGEGVMREGVRVEMMREF